MFQLSANGAYQDPKKADGFMSYYFNNEATLARLVKKSDHCPAVFKNDRRRNEDFVSCDFIFIDVDSGISIVDFSAHPDFSDRHFILLTSRSHQIEKKGVTCDRFHVLLPVAQITDGKELAEKLNRLCELYPFADRSAKGAARFWNGNADTKIIWHDGKEYQFPVHAEKFVDDMFDTPTLTPKIKQAPRLVHHHDDKQQKTMSALRTTVAGGLISDYQDWINLGMGMKAEGYAFSDWERLLHIGKSPDSETMAQASYKWDTFNPQKITGGTVMHFARLGEPDLFKPGTGSHKAEKLRIGKPTDKIRLEDLPAMDQAIPMEVWREDHCVIKYEKDDDGCDTGTIKEFKVKPTLEQFEIMLDFYGIRIQENLMIHKVECLIPGATDGGKVENSAVGKIKSLCVLNNLPIANSSFDSYLATIANARKHHPVRDWLDTLQWDGVSRLPDLYGTMTATADFSLTFKETLIRKWFLSCVAAIYENSYTGRGVLTIQGAQSLGKTSWFRSLFPSWLKCFKDGLTLDPRSKDSISIAISHWVCELGELEGTFKRADIAALKAFVTMSSDTIRMPYERREETYERRTIFAASVNSPIFLSDQTGTSRFWAIRAKQIDYNHDIDINQLWAELCHIYHESKSDGDEHIWWLSPMEETMLAEQNGEHTESDQFDEVFYTHFADMDSGCANHWTITQALHEIGYDKPSRFEINKFRDIIIKQDLKRTKVRGKIGYYFPNVIKVAGDKRGY